MSLKYKDLSFIMGIMFVHVLILLYEWLQTSIQYNDRKANECTNCIDGLPYCSVNTACALLRAINSILTFKSLPYRRL